MQLFIEKGLRLEKNLRNLTKNKKNKLFILTNILQNVIFDNVKSLV